MERMNEFRIFNNCIFTAASASARVNLAAWRVARKLVSGREDDVEGEDDSYTK